MNQNEGLGRVPGSGLIPGFLLRVCIGLARFRVLEFGILTMGLELISFLP